MLYVVSRGHLDYTGGQDEIVHLVSSVKTATARGKPWAFTDRSEVEVLVFEPNGAPPAEAMRNETKKPKMTPGRAALLALMSRYLVPGYDYRLSLLEVQKLAYLLQVAGEPLRLS